MSNCIHFATDDDEHARTVEEQLRAHGFEPRRQLGERGSDVFALAAALAKRRYRLTNREHEVLEALLRGRDRKATAAQLGVSSATITWHLKNVYAKLDVPTAAAALRRALLLDDPRWLTAPQRPREALARLLDAVGQVLRARGDGRELDDALAKLERVLEVACREAFVELPATGDERIVLRLTK